MHSSCGLPALLLPPLLLLVAATGPGGALSDDEKRALVELHNLYRSQVSPPASDMLQMVSAACDGRGAGYPWSGTGLLALCSSQGHRDSPLRGFTGTCLGSHLETWASRHSDPSLALPKLQAPHPYPWEG